MVVMNEPVDDSRSDTRSDRELAEAIVHRGDEAAFRLLYRRHTPRLYQFLLRVVGGGEHDAEDAVQETWLRACRALGRFRWDCAFSSWLTGIGLNVARSWLRQRASSREAVLDELPEPPARAAPPDGRVDLERAIAALPDSYRAVLVLHDVEGFKHGEIADRLGIAEGTSKSQLFAARRLMRARLGLAQG